MIAILAQLIALMFLPVKQTPNDGLNLAPHLLAHELQCDDCIGDFFLHPQVYLLTMRIASLQISQNDNLAVPLPPQRGS